MIDEKYIELVQADVDGELSAERRAELNRFLLTSQEARAMRAQLAAIAGTLGGLVPAEPPADLRERILSRLPPQSRRASGAGDSRFSGGLRWAAGLAAATLLGAIVFRIASEDHSALDSAKLSGTMASPGEPAPSVAPYQIDEVAVSVEQVRGTVSLLGSPQARIVEFNLAVDGPVELFVEHEGERTRVIDLGRPLVIAGPAPAGVPLTVEVQVPGAPVHRFELGVPARQ
jgi:hypothetical protein